MTFKPVTIPQQFGKNSPGRKPLKLMEAAFVPTLIGYLEEGMGFETSCDLCGVAPKTVKKNVREGLRDLADGRETKLADFAYQVNAAMASAKRARITNITNAGKIPAFWGASAWWLERMYPQEYGKQDRLAITVQQTQAETGDVSLLDLSDDEADALGSALAKLEQLRGESSANGSESLGLGSGLESEWND